MIIQAFTFFCDCSKCGRDPEKYVAVETTWQDAREEAEREGWTIDGYKREGRVELHCYAPDHPKDYCAQLRKKIMESRLAKEGRK